MRNNIIFLPYNTCAEGDIFSTIAHGPKFDVIITHNGNAVLQSRISYKPDLKTLSNITDSSPDDIKKQMENYLHGEEINFKVKTVLDLSDFGRNIISRLVNVSYGQTVSYGELARIAGYPKAARAVGTIMKKNRIPVIIPCHRVLSANGLGSYSAEHGIYTKKLLLELENITTAH